MTSFLAAFHLPAPGQVPDALQSVFQDAHRYPEAALLAPEECLADTPDGIVLFAGELRNRRELCQAYNLPVDLRPAQLVLALIEHHSPANVFRGLNGPFTLLWLDRRKQEWHLVRDQLGQSFLFHHLGQFGDCSLASDSLPRLKKALPALAENLDYAALSDYLALGYIPAPRTIYRSVGKVPPASETIVKSDGRTMVTERYWTPPFTPQCQIGFEDAVAESRTLLNRAVARCLEAHPKADFMLSGGIDSGTILGLVTHDFPDAARQAHTIAYDSRAYDESPIATATAQRNGVPCTPLHLGPDAIQTLPGLLAGSGEPYADSSLLATAAAVRASTQPAIFTGDGGDEIFGGYRRYQAMLLRGKCPPPLQAFARPFCRALAWLIPASRDNRSRRANWKRTLHSLGLTELAAYGSFQEICSSDLRHELQQVAPGDRRCPGLLIESATPHYLPGQPELDWNNDSRFSLQNYLADWESLADAMDVAEPVQRYNGLDLQVYLPDDGFRKTDLAAAGTGVTLLCPILDMDVVRFALSLPVALRFDARENKRILRALGRDSLAPEALATPKRGFGIPMAEWLRGPLAPLMRSLADDIAQWDEFQLLSPATVRRLVEEHLAGRANHASRLWMLHCLRIWEETH